MIKKYLWVIAMMLVATTAMPASKSLTNRIVDLLEKQHVHVVANGETVSLFVPVKVLFAEDSTNLVGNPGLLAQVRGLVNRYNPKQVEVIGHMPTSQAAFDQDLLSTQTRLFMRELKLKAPGRIVVSGLEQLPVNKNLKFWQEFNYQTSIEVRWKVNLNIDYMVLDA